MNKKQSFLLGLIALITIVLLGVPAQAIIIGFKPISQEVILGSSVDVELVISGLGAGGPDSLGGLDLDIDYDPTILQFTAYNFGSGLGSNVSTDFYDPIADAYDGSFGDPFATGVIDLFELSWLPDFSFQSDSFTLATLTFTGFALGRSPLSFSQAILSDALGNPLDVSEILTGSITVTSAPVPEPAS